MSPRFLEWLERPRWAVVVYQGAQRICVLEVFIFRATAASYAGVLNNASRTNYPKTLHLVERIVERPHPGDRCLQSG